MQINTKANPGTKYRVWRPHRLVCGVPPAATRDPGDTAALAPPSQRGAGPRPPCGPAESQLCCEIKGDLGFVNTQRR